MTHPDISVAGEAADAYAAYRDGRPQSAPPRRPRVDDRPNSALWALVELIGEAAHSASHSLAQIAADVHAMRAAVEEAAPVVNAYRRGGPLAARTAARQQRKGNIP